MIDDARLKMLNSKPVQNRDYVLYWMQASQRAEHNHALEYAINLANERKKQLLVYVGITNSFPDANERHYYFMLQGLQELQKTLKNRGVQLLIRRQSPELGAVELAQQADLLIADCGYLRMQRAWRTHVAEHIDCAMIQVESDVVVPVDVAYPKESWSAGTLRPKISNHIGSFLSPVPQVEPIIKTSDIQSDSLDISDISIVIAELRIDQSVRKSEIYSGGSSEARKHLKDFIETKLDKYDELRNDPSLDYVSNMSPYLHFGQISPIEIAVRVLDSRSSGAEAYLEELIVRRELSMNFVYYNSDYDQYICLPNWAQQTLSEHRNDSREYIYSEKELEFAQTHDPYWNAAQSEMAATGKMHGYMRMYWGKKILEWTSEPDQAFNRALYLNNKYEIDGRDPNGFTGVAWCFGKHDRAWSERPVFGKVRYMNANGLKRKFDVDMYVRNINKLKG